jgi:transposase
MIVYDYVHRRLRRQKLHEFYKNREACEKLLIQCRDLVPEISDPIAKLRLSAINMISAGHSKNVVCDIVGVSGETINIWVDVAYKQGIDAIKNMTWQDSAYEKNNRRKILTRAQFCELDKVAQEDAKNYGYKVWNDDSLSDYILNKFGANVTVEKVRNLMNRIGYRVAFPTRVLKELNGKVNKYKKCFDANLKNSLCPYSVRIGYFKYFKKNRGR